MKSETSQQARNLMWLMTAKNRAIDNRVELYINDLEKLPEFQPGAEPCEQILEIARENRVAGVARSVARLLREQAKRLSQMANEFDIFGAKL